MVIISKLINLILEIFLRYVKVWAWYFNIHNYCQVRFKIMCYCTLKVLTNLRAEEARDKLKEMAIQADLWDEIKQRLHKPAASLSGGQQQRLC